MIKEKNLQIFNYILNFNSSGKWEPPRPRIISLLHSFSVVSNEYCYLILASWGKGNFVNLYLSFDDFLPTSRKLKSCKVLCFLSGTLRTANNTLALLISRGPESVGLANKQSGRGDYRRRCCVFLQLTAMNLFASHSWYINWCFESEKWKILSHCRVQLLTTS